MVSVQHICEKYKEIHITVTTVVQMFGDFFLHYYLDHPQNLRNCFFKHKNVASTFLWNLCFEETQLLLLKRSNDPYCTDLSIKVI